MKVLINAINARQGGGQTYLFNLLACEKVYKRANITLLVGMSFDVTLIPNTVKIVRVGRFIENPFLRPWWERFMLPRVLLKGSYDVLFCPGGIVNTTPSRAKVVTMSRNMLPFDSKQRNSYPLLSYQRLRNWLLARMMSRSMASADLVIFISRYAKEMIERYLGKQLRSSVIIPHGVANRFKCKNSEALPYPSSMPKKYLLYVSNVDVYKAQLEVVQAFAMLNPKKLGLHLVIVGPERSYYAECVRAEISRLDLEDYVIMEGVVSYALLPSMYQHAVVNIFASKCENCPNILLEMMASGRPIVCSNYRPMPEFAGDSVLYFDPSKPIELKAVLEQAMFDLNLQKTLKDSMKLKISEYCWEDSADRTWDAIANIVDEREKRNV